MKTPKTDQPHEGQVPAPAEPKDNPQYADDDIGKIVESLTPDEKFLLRLILGKVQEAVVNNENPH